MKEQPDRPSSLTEPGRADDTDGGARAKEAARLLHAARALRPNVRVTLPEIQAAIRARRHRATITVGRMAAVAAIALCPVLALGAVGASRGWWTRAVPAAETSVVVPAGGTVKIGRRGRFTLALQGPAAIDVRGDDQPIHLEAGRLEVANEGRTAAVAVEAAGHHIEVAPSSTVAVEATGAPGAGTGLRLTTIAGSPPRLDGAPHAEAAPALEPPAARTSTALPSSPGPASPPSAIVDAPAKIGAIGAIVTSTEPLPAAARTGAPGAAPRATVAAPTTATDEVAIFRDALQRLRSEQNAAAAMRLLDEHDRRFPDGLLRDEAAVTRIEALLALGRNGDALQRLESLAPALLDRSPRLRVTRGELRASQGQCRQALADFEAVSASHPGGVLAERIERGRAACNSEAARHTGEAGGNQ